MKINSLTYAGHSAVFLNADKYTIAIDPWLESNPRCPEKLKRPAQLDLIVLTHGHSDHASDAARLVKHYGSKLAATWELAMIMVREGVPESNIIPMNKGGTVTHSSISVTLTHALHSSSYDGSNGSMYAGEACGVIIKDDSRAFYHGGDTALFSDMQLIRDRYRPEIAFLPIGDRFTMGPEEAALAAKLVGARLAFPIHYKTFPLLTGSAEVFRAECARYDIQGLELEPGEPYRLS